MVMGSMRKATGLRITRSRSPSSSKYMTNPRLLKKSRHARTSSSRDTLPRPKPSDAPSVQHSESAIVLPACSSADCSASYMPIHENGTCERSNQGSEPESREKALRRTAHSQVPACAARDCLTTTLERDKSSNSYHLLALAAAHHPCKTTRRILPGPLTGAQARPHSLRASRTTSDPAAGAQARLQKIRNPPRSHGSHLYRETIWNGGRISYGMLYWRPRANPQEHSKFSVGPMLLRNCSRHR